MDYNTQREKLIIPEYGRNIQKMVDHLKTVEDREKRNKLAKALIQIMGNINPHLRDVADFKHKLWDHLMIMSSFELDIDAPYPPPKQELLNEKPNRVPYNVNRIRYRHYGKTVERMLTQVSELEESEKRQNLIKVVANHMKKSYVMWNKDHVEDEFIFQAIEKITDGKVKPDRNIKLKNVRALLYKSSSSSSSSNNNSKSKGKKKKSKK